MNSASPKIVLTTCLTIGMFVLQGCSSREITIEQTPPAKYEKVGQAKGSATGSLGILATAYNVVPMGLNSRTKRAYDNALNSQPEATGLINVTYQEDWFWWFIGTARTVTISGDAIKEVKE